MRLDAWRLGVPALAGLLALPVLVIAAFVLVPGGEVWRHLAATVLGEYLLHSLWLMLGVGAGVLLLGVPAAWLVVHAEFPGRRFFEWALLLPMAVPAYILAYTWTGLMDFAGPIQTMLRDVSGWSAGDYWFPALRSLPGAVVVLSLVLYPYVYLLTRAALLEQSHSLPEVARSLGAGPGRALWQVTLPLARPAIVTGVSLALMETLADYGTVQYFGVTTFTTGIFRTWLGLGDAAAAVQLAAVLVGAVLLLVMLERISRRGARYHASGRVQPLTRQPLRKRAAVVAVVFCMLPLLLGFAIPAWQLLAWAIRERQSWLGAEFAGLAGNTLMLAAGAALVIALLALLLAYGRRQRPTAVVQGATRLAALGYAVPGAVIAIGVLLPLGWLDNRIDDWLRANFGISSGLLLSGTLFAVGYAYAVRFMAVALNTLDDGLGRIRPSMDQAARSLGRSPLGVVRGIHLPMLHASLLSALVLVFVDVMKELPATLILRPFNFNTLAVRTYELASDERLAEAAAPALCIVLTGLLPVVLLARTLRPAKERSHA